ncbi:MAG: tRNA (adenosine(37)-N6)-threonylcarbamoyltransferase complex dimerization subunit type 1 TsaB [Patescibacteria group bacterium]
MERFVSYQNRRGQKLVGVFHQPDGYKPRAAVLVCHGFNDRKERDFIRNICVEASRRGLAALRFDFSGQGKSDGQFDQITYTRYLQDVSASLAFLSRQGITHIGIVGHSMGGALAALTARRDRRVAALVGLAPVAQIYETHTRRWRDQYKAGQAKYLFMHDIRNPKRTIKIGLGFLRDAKHYDLIREARQITQPSLLIIGNKDTRVFTKEVQALYRQLGSVQKKFLRLDECDHVFSGHEKEIASVTVDWFVRYLFTRLYIDTSEMNVIHVALLKNGRIITLTKKIAFDQRDTLLRVISGFIAKHKIGVHQLDAIVVNRGPGPFTALRVGITVANTLGLARNIPVIGIRKDMAVPQPPEIEEMLFTLPTTDDFVRPWYDKKPNITKPKPLLRHS